ncbi:unnamed protein product [Dovyalis caffra]|uniref:Uncharacterized protein n=1 Tax=Dovyalis caffra TaxID=77055 RepID=A0AAV1RXF9_9ROSI|nr:unnamed protein product [Dovyalis caffra]
MGIKESEGNETFHRGAVLSYGLQRQKGAQFCLKAGIGRGDQPITFAANLVSYRAGGGWSTTCAPSPFYITSKMRSLYLEGYNYSVFDLTRHDRVQIQELRIKFFRRLLQMYRKDQSEGQSKKANDREKIFCMRRSNVKLVPSSISGQENYLKRKVRKPW